MMSAMPATSGDPPGRTRHLRGGAADRVDHGDVAGLATPLRARRQPVVTRRSPSLQPAGRRAVARRAAARRPGPADRGGRAGRSSAPSSTVSTCRPRPTRPPTCSPRPPSTSTARRAGACSTSISRPIRWSPDLGGRAPSGARSDRRPVERAAPRDRRRAPALPRRGGCARATVADRPARVRPRSAGLRSDGGARPPARRARRGAGPARHRGRPCWARRPRPARSSTRSNAAGPPS